MFRRFSLFRFPSVSLVHVFYGTLYKVCHLKYENGCFSFYCLCFALFVFFFCLSLIYIFIDIANLECRNQFFVDVLDILLVTELMHSCNYQFWWLLFLLLLSDNLCYSSDKKPHALSSSLFYVPYLWGLFLPILRFLKSLLRRILSRYLLFGLYFCFTVSFKDTFLFFCHFRLFCL